MKKKILKKSVSLLLAVMMIVSLLPQLTVPAHAVETDNYKRLRQLQVGDKVTFGGYNWIVLDPSTGYLLMDEVYGQGPFSPVSGGFDRINVYEEYNVGSLLNNAAVTVNDKGELAAYGHGFAELPGFLASMAKNNSDYLKLILQHTWATGNQGHEGKPSPYASVSDTFKVALLSYDEFNAYKDIPGVVLSGQAWWLRTGTTGGDQEVWAVNNSSLEIKNFTTKVGIRPAMYVNTNTFFAATATAGQYEIVLPQPNAVSMPTTPTFATGTYAGLTSVTATATLAGGKLAVQLSHHAITTPQNSFQITDISAESDSKGIVYPYTSGSDIGFAKAGDYIGVYDLDNKGHVYAFTQHQLTNDDIKQATYGLREPLKYMEAGSIIRFAGVDWVLLDPATGYMLMKGQYSKESVGSYSDDGPFDAYLNSLTYATDFPNVQYSSEGFYKHLTETYPNDISLIQDHEWTQTVYFDTGLNEVFGTNTIKSKIGLLSRQEFIKYRSLIPDSDSSWWYWLIDSVYSLFHNERYAPIASYGGVMTGPADTKEVVIVRPALYLDPTVEVYVGNNNVVRAVADLKTAPSAASGTLGTTTVTAVPNASTNTLKYKWSAKDIIPPEVYTSAPAGLLDSNENIPAKPGDYIGVYEIDSTNKVVAYGELQLTADMCSPVAPQITPNGGSYDTAQTVSLSFNAGIAGDTAYYTTDGSDPYTSDTKIKYTAPFTVDHSMTLRAQVLNSGLGGWSKITSADFIRHSEINPMAATFDKNTQSASHKDLSVELALNGNELTGIRKGSAVLTPGMHYTLSGNTVTIAADYLSGFDSGSFDLTFEFSKGNSAVLSITIISSDIQDSAVSEVNTIFDQNPYGNLYADLPVTLHLNGNALVNVKNGTNTLVRGTDYVVTDESTVILKKAYLSNIKPARNKSTLTFVFDKGKNTNTASLEIKLINSSLATVTIKARDSQGNLYADGTGHMLFFIPATDGEQWGLSMKAGTVYALAGNATGGYAGDGGPVMGAAFSDPKDISIDHNGNIYIRDYGNRVIREIAAADGEQWGISMKAGNIYTVTPASPMANIMGMWVDQDGSIIYSLTAGEYCIKMQAAVSGTKYGITMEAGKTYTIAGNGSSGGNISDGEVALESPTDAPAILTTDKSENIYFVKYGAIIYMLPAADGTYFNRAMTAGHVYLVAGRGIGGYTGDGQNARQALFDTVAGIAVDENGNLFIADKDNNVIREVAGTTMTQNGVSVTAGNIYTVAVADSFDCSQGVYANKTGGIWIPDSALGKFGVREISTPTPTVPVASVDKKELSKALSDAVLKIKSTMVGTAVGSVPQEAKDTFQSAIDAATAVKTNASATQAEVDAQLTALYSARDVFSDAIVEQKYLTGIPAPVGITDLVNGVPKTKAGLTLPDTVIIETDEGNVQADVTWDVNSSSYHPDNTAEQTFTVSGTITLPGNVRNIESIPLNVSISVTVNDASAATLQSIAITTPANKLAYTVGDSLDISGMVVTGTYSDNSSKPVSVTTANITGFDSSAPAVDQVLTVKVGSKTATYTVTITAAPDTRSSAKAITGFSIGGVDGTIKETDHTIAVTLPYGTSVTSLSPTVTVSDKATVSPTSGTAQDFTNPVTYTVTAENESTQDYTVKVTVESDARSSAKAITGFSIDGVNGTINESDHTIAVTLPYGTSVTSLSPTVTVSDKASVSPTSGTTQDFPSPVTYTVTAENKSTQDYTVKVTVESDARSSAKAITGFSIGGVNGTIKETDHTIAVTLPYGTSIMSLSPTVTVSDKAGVSPTSGTARDFTNPVTYTVKAENESTQTYTVTVTVESDTRSSAKAITGFSVGGLSGTISESDHTIAITLPYGTSITSLSPNVTVSDKASVSPTSGTTQDFTSPVTYTVKAENESTQTYTVTVTVAPANSYSISLDKSGTQAFSTQTEGYSSASPMSVKVSNTGNQETGALTMVLSGTNVSSFTLSKTAIGSIAKDGSDTFTIKPNDSLTAGTYTATVTVSGSSVTSRTFTVSFTVSSASTGGNAGIGGSSSGGGNSSTSSKSNNITVTTGNNTTTAAQSVNSTTSLNGVATASVSKDQIAGLVKAASEKAQEQNTQKSIEIKVDSGSNATGLSVTIPQASASSLTDGVNSLTIASPTVTVTFDEKALAEIAKNTTGDITVKAVKPEETAISEKDKAIIGNRPIYDLKVTSGSTAISTFGGGTATVSVPYKPATGEDTSKIVVYYISGSGKLIMVPDCVYDASTGTVTFKTTHFSSYAVAYNDVSFTDISGWYTDYVNYLAAREIIGGTGDGQFNPNATITRAQFVTILARMSGDDQSGYTSSEFTDVSASDWYFAAVQWAYKNGIASGYGGKFNPGANITREQMAVMLFNYAKHAGIDVSNVEGMSLREFSDYESIPNWAMAPIQWAINNNIVSGNSNGSFAPQSSATRAQAAKMIAVLMQRTVK